MSATNARKLGQGLPKRPKHTRAYRELRDDLKEWLEAAVVFQELFHQHPWLRAQVGVRYEWSDITILRLRASPRAAVAVRDRLLGPAAAEFPFTPLTIGAGRAKVLIKGGHRVAIPLQGLLRWRDGTGMPEHYRVELTYREVASGPVSR